MGSKASTQEAAPPSGRRRRGTRPGLTRKASRELTRARLVAAARVEFAAAGLEGANLTDILRRAGVSPGAFYHQFADKTDLFLAVLAELSLLLRRLIRESRGTLDNPGADVRAWIEALYMRGIVIAREHRELFQIFMREMHAGNPRVHAYLEHDRGLFHREISDGLQALIDRGDLPPFDTGWAAYMLWMLSLSGAAQQLLNPADDAAWARAMARLTIGGVPGLQDIPGAVPVAAVPADERLDDAPTAGD